MEDGISHSSEEMVTDSECVHLSASLYKKKTSSDGCQSTQSSQVIPYITRSLEEEGKKLKYENLKNLLQGDNMGAQDTAPLRDGCLVTAVPLAVKDIVDEPPEKRMRFKDNATGATQYGDSFSLQEPTNKDDVLHEEIGNKLTSVPNTGLCLRHEQQECSRWWADVENGCGEDMSDSRELEEFSKVEKTQGTEQKFSSQYAVEAHTHAKAETTSQAYCRNYEHRRSRTRERSSGGEMPSAPEMFCRINAGKESPGPRESRSSDENGPNENRSDEPVCTNYHENKQWVARPQEESENVFGTKFSKSETSQAILLNLDIIEKYIPPQVWKTLSKFMKTQKTCDLTDSGRNVLNSDGEGNDDSSPSLINKDFLKGHVVSELKDPGNSVVHEATDFKNNGFAGHVPDSLVAKAALSKKNSELSDSNAKKNPEDKVRGLNSNFGTQMSFNGSMSPETGSSQARNTFEVPDTEKKGAAQENNLFSSSLKGKESLCTGDMNEHLSEPEKNTSNDSSEEVNKQSVLVGNAHSKTSGTVGPKANSQGEEETSKKSNIHCSFSPSEVSSGGYLIDPEENYLVRLNACEQFLSSAHHNGLGDKEAGGETRKLSTGVDPASKESNICKEQSEVYNDSTQLLNSTIQQEGHDESQISGEISRIALMEERRMNMETGLDNSWYCKEENISLAFVEKQTDAALSKYERTEAEMYTRCPPDGEEILRRNSECYVSESYHEKEISDQDTVTTWSFVSRNSRDLNKITECHKQLESPASLNSAENASTPEVLLSKVTLCASAQRTVDFKVKGDFPYHSEKRSDFKHIASSGSEKRSRVIDNSLTKTNEVQDFVTNNLKSDYSKDVAILENLEHSSNLTSVSETPTNRILSRHKYVGNPVSIINTEDFDPITSSTSTAIRNSIPAYSAEFNEKQLNVEDGVSSQNTATVVFNVSVGDYSTLQRTPQGSENTDCELHQNSTRSNYGGMNGKKRGMVRRKGAKKTDSCEKNNTIDQGKKNPGNDGEKLRTSIQVEQCVYEEDVDLESESLIKARDDSTQKSGSLLKSVSCPLNTEDSQCAVASYDTNDCMNKYDVQYLPTKRSVCEEDVDLESESLVKARKDSTERSVSLLQSVSYPQKKEEDTRCASSSYVTNDCLNKCEVQYLPKNEDNCSAEERGYSSESVIIISDEDSSLSSDIRTGEMHSKQQKATAKESQTFDSWTDVIVPSVRIKNTNKQREGRKHPRRSNRMKLRSRYCKSSDDSDFDYQFVPLVRTSKQKRRTERETLKKEDKTEGYDENNNSLLLLRIQARLQKVKTALKKQSLDAFCVQRCSVWMAQIRCAIKTAAMRILGGRSFSSKPKSDSLRTQSNSLYHLCGLYRKLKVTVRSHLKSHFPQKQNKQEDLVQHLSKKTKKVAETRAVQKTGDGTVDRVSDETVYPSGIKLVQPSQSIRNYWCGGEGDGIHVNHVKPCFNNCCSPALNIDICSSAVSHTSDTLTLPSNGTTYPFQGEVLPRSVMSISSANCQILPSQCLDTKKNDLNSKKFRTNDEHSRKQQDFPAKGDDVSMPARLHKTASSESTMPNGKQQYDLTPENQGDACHRNGNASRKRRNSSKRENVVESCLSFPLNHSDFRSTEELTNLDTTNSESLIQKYRNQYPVAGNCFQDNIALPASQQILLNKEEESNTELAYKDHKNDQEIMPFDDDLQDKTQVLEEQPRDTDYQTSSDLIFQQLPPVNNNGYRIPAALVKDNPTKNSASFQPQGDIEALNVAKKFSDSTLFLNSCSQPEQLKAQAALKHRNVVSQDLVGNRDKVADCNNVIISETSNIMALPTPDTCRTSSELGKSREETNVRPPSSLSRNFASSSKVNASNKRGGLGKGSREKTGCKNVNTGLSEKGKRELSRTTAKNSVLMTGSANCLGKRKTENLNSTTLHELIMEKKLSAGVNVLSVHTPMQTEFATLSSAGHVIDRNGCEFVTLVDWCRSIKNFSAPGSDITQSDCYSRVSFQGRLLSSFLEPRQGLSTQDNTPPETERSVDCQVIDKNGFSERDGVEVIDLSKMKLLLIGDDELSPNDSEWPGQWNDFDKWSP